ncbi:prolipoprotein diacylglyceryl transferase [Deltaproteobacteria bacterium Smac51]|nr:prolipoprotein diacylglyceryl transferase [Deltaproteobacteria bacterium Smac51]
MFPVPVQLGPLSLSFYGLMVAAGVLAALALFSYTAPRRQISPAAARDFCFWMILAGLLGSRVWYVVFHWPEFSDDLPGVFAYWRGGLMFQGGVVAALLLSPVFLRRYNLKFWPAADVMAPSLALGQCFGRLGCFAAGCCYGRPTDSTFAVTFPPGSLAPAGIPLMPVQLIESAALLVLTIVLVLAIKAWTGRRPGGTASLYLAGTGLIRLIMEVFFRGDYRGEPIIGTLPPTTLTAMAALAAGLILLIWRGPQRRME